jgi:hypothetical protein
MFAAHVHKEDHMKRLPLIAAAVLITTTLGLTTTADASDHGWQIIHHRGQVTGGQATDFGTACDPANQCVGLVRTVDVVFGGDDAGTGVQGNAFVVSPTGILVSTVTSTFVGTVKHCGTGTAVYTVVGSADLNKSSILHYIADIVPGTGTGDLTGITGHFTGATDVADPNSPATSDGTIRCRRHS